MEKVKAFIVKLTLKQKIIISAVLCVVLVIGGYYLALRPVLSTYQSNRNELTKKQDELAELQTQLTNNQNAPAQLEAESADYKKLTAKYYTKLTNEKISQLITDEITGASMTPMSLSVSSSPITSKKKVVATAATSSSSVITVRYVEATCSGTLDQASALISNVGTNMKGTFVTDIAYATPETSEKVTEDEFNIQLTVYMINK